MEASGILRRRGELDTWHLRPDCSRWPRDDVDYQVLALDEWAPKKGPLCNQCRAKQDADRC